ncbi:molybdopterin cofactor-binding domain-containing protein, partial [candidate division CSSED10-310 bacterium]
FLKDMSILGGGIMISMSLNSPDLLARTSREGYLASRLPTDFNAFLRIGVDERITLLTGKVELGQGVITSLPQLLAEELDVSYEAVDILMGDTDLCPWDAGTFGSLSIRYFGIFLREAAAEAVGVLKELAAEHLKTPVNDLETADGAVYVKSEPGRKISYGQLTKGKIIERHLPDVPPLETAADYTVMGKSHPRRDTRDKVTGRARYAGDIRVPGMLYASVLRPPAHGAVLKKVDLSAAQKMAGVTVVQDGDFIATLHHNPDEAAEALASIEAEYLEPLTGINHDNIFEHLLKNAPAPEISKEQGRLEVGAELSTHQFDETYYNAYVAHSPLETHTATAMIEGDKIVVWSSTQQPFGDRKLIAQTLNMPEEKIQVKTPYVGGGFGGKNSSQQAAEAARLAKMTGRPVQVAWTRKEEIFYDTFRPAAIVQIKSGLDGAGRIVYWDYTVYYAGTRGSEPNYDIPHLRVASAGSWRGSSASIHPFAVGPWRAPANNTNVFARELQMNLMAAQAKIDPLEFRLANLKDERMITVLKAAAKAFDWNSSQTPSGRGQGIACGVDAGTYVATMADVEVHKISCEIKVNRIVCAQDMGFVVNPTGARSQIEGCLTMGLGYALGEQIRFQNGKILDHNFDTYIIPRFSWVPTIETVLVDNYSLAPQGGGEPAIITMGGVIATAVFDAVGAVCTSLPITPLNVLKAIKKGKISGRTGP